MVLDSLPGAAPTNGLSDQNPESISGWPIEDQPRRRIAKFGAEQLSTAELLGICLGSGLRGEDAVSMARRLLTQFGSLRKLLLSPITHLNGVRGLGPAKIAVLKAVAELGARGAESELADARNFSQSQDVANYLQQRLGYQPRENFACLFLSVRLDLIAFEVLFRGSVDHAHVHAREILRRGLELNAGAVILAHNHPSGVAEPSQSDVALTRELVDLLARIDIRVVDHIVVSPRQYVSFAARGLLP